MDKHEYKGWLNSDNWFKRAFAIWGYQVALGFIIWGILVGVTVIVTGFNVLFGGGV